MMGRTHCLGSVTLISWSTEMSVSTCFLPLGHRIVISSTTLAFPMPNSRSMLSMDR